MEIAGSSQARSATGASRAARTKDGSKARRAGQTSRDRELHDIFEHLVAETMATDEVQRLASNEQEEARDDAHRSEPPKPVVRKDDDAEQPRIDVQA
ncbi:MAG: hypothetical protein KAS72_09085 [Phycisphaerales bacterium]|nr:hypothetical protein [Phycisphaerales bacterium]